MALNKSKKVYYELEKDRFLILDGKVSKLLKN